MLKNFLHAEGKMIPDRNMGLWCRLYTKECRVLKK